MTLGPRFDSGLKASVLQDRSERRDHCVPRAKKEKDPLGHSIQIQKGQSGQDAASRLFGF